MLSTLEISVLQLQIITPILFISLPFDFKYSISSPDKILLFNPNILKTLLPSSVR